MVLDKNPALKTVVNKVEALAPSGPVPLGAHPQIAGCKGCTATGKEHPHRLLCACGVRLEGAAPEEWRGPPSPSVLRVFGVALRLTQVGSITNEFRVFDMEVIAGKPELETEVRQFNSVFRLNFSEVRMQQKGTRASCRV